MAIWTGSSLVARAADAWYSRMVGESIKGWEAEAYRRSQLTPKERLAEDRKRERDRRALARQLQQAEAAALREEAELWLSIYAPDQVYDPKVHYKPDKPCCDCSCHDYD